MLGPFEGSVIETHASDIVNLRELLANGGKAACGREAFETLRIEAGVPLFGVDFDERNFPQEVGRDREAISYTKGCYLGQETVARIDALGHVHQRIVGVKFEGEGVPPAGTELTADGNVVGRVTSATFSPRLGAPLALAMVRREQQALGSRFQSKFGAGVVLQLPLAAA
jgi:folate-binding protein YgfZ